MLKKILIALLISITAIVSGTIGYAVGHTKTNGSVSLQDYDVIDQICRRAAFDKAGYESEDFTMSECKVAIFKATGKI